MPRSSSIVPTAIFAPDREGTELPDLAAARLEALNFAAQSVKDQPDPVQSASPLRVEVSDDTGMLLSTVIILEIETPAARGVRGPSPTERNWTHP